MITVTPEEITQFRNQLIDSPEAALANNLLFLASFVLSYHPVNFDLLLKFLGFHRDYGNSTGFE
ncbi:hypothetical protein [Nostoc sp. 'Peltigera malacea cyanobiont' DB3992]|uniref:hypothetical protein n=1 Tax=Nostoc sp. 'Peltigera malacea cyanobiont' DB3992 TaxID=1206980 RepID=UPI000C05D07E|nr:hypothetical protein [Nostoc sp. 'Peltigera malacea cyanobiont' DB3992]PHM09555.1 hypothetical protein CK516_13935 [Nostoc sp. 'Peltigera malacea cyanobiont' DB3992]